jgi:drug/metabolite transporter (DMT)-like permease
VWRSVVAIRDEEFQSAAFLFLLGAPLVVAMGWRFLRVLRGKAPDPESRHALLLTVLLLCVVGGFALYDAFTGGGADAVIGGLIALVTLPFAASVAYGWVKLRSAPHH